ncbi:MAG TPA: RAD55 family ATPase [Candidatus Binatus sp.]|nr:RAD55 family ATPase [Candidatus Binatus sp.]
MQGSTDEKPSKVDHRHEALMPSGISILDQVLGGGFPRPCAVTLMGPIGSGKSALVRELAVNFLRQGTDLLYYCMDEPADIVRLGLEDHNLPVPSLESEGRLVFVDMFSKGAEKLAESLPHMDPEAVLEETMKFQDLLEYGRSFAMKSTGRGKVIILDSITPFFLLAEPRKVLQYVQVMRFATRVARAVTLSVLHTEVVSEQLENATVNLADGVIEMKKRTGEVLIRGGILKVLRMGRSTAPSRGYFYQLTDQGLVFSNSPIL